MVRLPSTEVPTASSGFGQTIVLHIFPGNTVGCILLKSCTTCQQTLSNRRDGATYEAVAGHPAITNGCDSTVAKVVDVSRIRSRVAAVLRPVNMVSQAPSVHSAEPTYVATPSMPCGFGQIMLPHTVFGHTGSCEVGPQAQLGSLVF